MHWVSMCTVWLSHSKWLSEKSNGSASNFARSSNIPLWKLFVWFEGHSYGQLVIGSFITTTCLLRPRVSSRAEFLWNIRSPRWLRSLQPRFGALWLLAFPQTKIFFEREETQTIDEIQENTTGQLMAIGRTGWGPTLKGTEASLSYVKKKGKGPQGACIKDPWTKPKVGRIEGGR